MCFVLTFVSAAAAYVLYRSDNIVAALAASAAALIFAALMARNILRTRKERENGDH